MNTTMPPYHLSGVQFGVFSPDEITRRSVLEVKSPETFVDNEPVKGGLFDPRMGVLDHDRMCWTCGCNNSTCPGHFGHILLDQPVFHVLFHATLRKVLRCICYRCGSLLLEEGGREGRKNGRDGIKGRNLDSIAQLSARCTVCRLCGARQPKYTAGGIGKLDIYMTFPRDEGEGEGHPRANPVPFSPGEILKVLRRVSQQDMVILGFHPDHCRPEWLLITVLPIPPPCVRPSVIMENGKRCEDDLTHKLSDIIKFNCQIKEKLGREHPNADVIHSLYQLLQYHIASYFHNSLPNMPPAEQRNGRRLKSICERLIRKEGRLRGNLNGKRVDQSARTVVTPDPLLSITEIGVPRSVAMNLVVPEEVNQYNIDSLREFVGLGPDHYPGARYVKRGRDGRMVSLRFADKKQVTGALQMGDTVYRHLMEGDPVLFNRQPSLHKVSMMQHYVRVMPYDTFRLSPTCCAPYNADFDGDEMNVMNPQSLAAACEIIDLAGVACHLRSPKNGKPIINLIQDTLTGLYILSTSAGRDKACLPPKVAVNMLMSADKCISGSLSGMNLPPTGHDVLKAIIPAASHHHLGRKGGGVGMDALDKQLFSRILIEVIEQQGEGAGKELLDQCQRLICRFSATHGFSCGISDLIVDPTVLSDVRNVADKTRLDIAELLASKSDLGGGKEREGKIMGRLSAITREAGERLKQTVSCDNRMIHMVRSGAKGNEYNLSQMMCAVGQQNSDGGRIPYGFTGRTLPHYMRYDDSPDARGFVQSSFLMGLSPQEAFFHAMSGREGVIDTAIKTSESGYVQRRLIKALEDCKVWQDYTVRGVSGSIIQFRYADDGFEIAKGVLQEMPCILRMTEEELEEAYNPWRRKWGEDGIFDEHMALLHRDRVALGILFSQIKEGICISHPVPFQSFVARAKMMAKSKGCGPSPSAAVRRIHRLVSDMQRVTGGDAANDLTPILVRAYLSSSATLDCLDEAAFDWLIEMVEKSFKSAVVPPGEMVGIITAQSIGEDTTQLTLNSFHSAGIAEKTGVTRGLPRLKELLSVTKHMKKPSLTILLKEQRGGGEATGEGSHRCIEDALRMKKNIEMLTVRDVLHSDEVSYHLPGEGGGRWELCLLFHRIALLRYNLDPVTILFRMMIEAPLLSEHICKCKCTDDSITILLSGSMSRDGLDALRIRLLDAHIHGIKGLRNVRLRELKPSGEWVLDTDGSNLGDILGYINGGEGDDQMGFRWATTNDVWEVYNVLGIEAARAALLHEFTEVLRDGSLNKRHLLLLVDLMTARGHFMSIDRHGINRSGSSPLTKSSFEETTDVLVKAGVFGEFDALEGVSARLILGQVPSIGTGDCDVLLNENMIFA